MANFNMATQVGQTVGNQGSRFCFRFSSASSASLYVQLRSKSVVCSSVALLEHEVLVNRSIASWLKPSRSMVASI